MIVESAKAKPSIEVSGNDFIVRSGVVRDLPVSGSGAAKPTISPYRTTKEQRAKAQQALVRRMGIDPSTTWVAHYEILPSKVKVIKELKSLAKDAKEIYLQTDLDRREAIAWHLKEVIGGSDDKYSRVVFNEITKKRNSKCL